MGRGGIAEKGATFVSIEGKGSEKFTPLRVSRQHPLVLLVNVEWNHVKAMGSEEGSLVGSGLFVTNLNYV